MTAAPSATAGASPAFMDPAKVSLELRQAFADGVPVERSLQDMLIALREYIPFDIATYAEYVSDGRTSNGIPSLLVRGLYAQDGDARFEWPSRWLRAPSALVAWLESDERAVDDIEAFFDRNPALRTLRRNDVVRTYLKRGARSFLIAVYKEGGHVVSSLTLARRGEMQFGPAEEALLDALQMPRVIRLIREGYKAQLAAFYKEMRDQFVPDADPAKVADFIVRRLCEQFRWDYVAIFRVARARSRFELITQFNNTKKRLTIQDEFYKQELDEGILSWVKTNKKPRRVRRLPMKETDKNPSNYKRITSDARSCLCYPIKLDGEVEWLLDCESAEVGAFQEPDELALQQLAQEAEKTITLWFEMRLNRALLENIDLGVVVVDEESRIQRINPEAARLLGVDAAEAQIGPDRAMGAGAIGKKLQEFGADEEARAVFDGSKVATKPISLRCADGTTTCAMVSSRDAEGAFNRRIWRLSSPAEGEWSRDLTYMRATIQGVAQQARGPLLLANALIARALDLLEGAPASLLLRRAGQCLAKTDITYERLAMFRDILREPTRRDGRFWVAFDLGHALGRFRDSLPADERTALILRIPDGLRALWADSERLGFAFRSTLGYLLSIRQPEQVVLLEAAARGGAVDVMVTVEGADPTILRHGPATNPVERFEADARAVAFHAQDAVEQVIAGHQGTLSIDASSEAVCLHISNLRVALEPAHAGA